MRSYQALSLVRSVAGGWRGVALGLRRGTHDLRLYIMLRKTARLVAACLICMPLGGLVSSAGGGPQGYVTQANTLTDSWMFDPAMMLIVCILLLAISKLSCQRRRTVTG